MNAASPSYTSYDDYLAREGASDVKHEWCDGVVYAMSRGTPEHARLAVRMARLLGNQLGRTCEVFGSDAMIYVEHAKLSTYADVSVVGGALETKKVVKSGKSLGEAITNPTVIVEVLSESTERYDRDGKFQAYKSLASLEEYVLVSQDAKAIEVYRRSASGAWTVQTGSAGATVTVHGKKIAVNDVYSKAGRG
ncbi:MAG: Uma2 family endonuclease [Deltaproteobacteria bacterium]|nr:Uma2 family endonuclease [Deltaproteobacteria bacterium]